MRLSGTKISLIFTLAVSVIGLLNSQEGYGATSEILTNWNLEQLKQMKERIDTYRQSVTGLKAQMEVEKQTSLDLFKKLASLRGQSHVDPVEEVDVDSLLRSSQARYIGIKDALLEKGLEVNTENLNQTIQLLNRLEGAGNKESTEMIQTIMAQKAVGGQLATFWRDFMTMQGLDEATRQKLARMGSTLGLLDRLLDQAANVTGKTGQNAIESQNIDQVRNLIGLIRQQTVNLVAAKKMVREAAQILKGKILNGQVRAGLLMANEAAGLTASYLPDLETDPEGFQDPVIKDITKEDRPWAGEDFRAPNPTVPSQSRFKNF